MYYLQQQVQIYSFMNGLTYHSLNGGGITFKFKNEKEATPKPCL